MGFVEKNLNDMIESNENIELLSNDNKELSKNLIKGYLRYKTLTSQNCHLRCRLRIFFIS